MKCNIIYTILLFYFLIGCKQRSKEAYFDSQYMIIPSEIQNDSRCYYEFNENQKLVKRFCFKEGIPEGNIIYYYENGIPKSIAPYKDLKLHGLKIDYYKSGKINSTTNYLAGRKTGQSNVYYENGMLNAINLVKDDSIYFVRVYSDSINMDSFTDEFLPLVLHQDSFTMTGDTAIIKVQYPIHAWREQRKLILRFDYYPAALLENKRPYAKKSVDITDVNVIIGLPSLTPHDKFFCYLTDESGKVLGGTIYRDIYYRKKESLE